MFDKEVIKQVIETLNKVARDFINKDRQAEVFKEAIRICIEVGLLPSWFENVKIEDYWSWEKGNYKYETCGSNALKDWFGLMEHLNLYCDFVIATEALPASKYFSNVLPDPEKHPELYKLADFLMRYKITFLFSDEDGKIVIPLHQKSSEYLPWIRLEIYKRKEDDP